MPDGSDTGGVMTWTRAYGLGIGITLYFVIATIWLPSYVLKLGFVAGAPAVIRDTIGAGVWFVFLAVGFVGLRLAQRRGLI